MSGFTPGPWRINPAAKEEVVADGEVMIIARVPSGASGLYNRHAPANARLIAAAPEFYALAEKVLDLLQRDAFYGDASDEVHRACVAALTKARGDA